MLVASDWSKATLLIKLHTSVLVRAEPTIASSHGEVRVCTFVDRKFVGLPATERKDGAL